MYRMDFSFAKKDDMRFISHLDLMRLFSRAMRRAEIPVKITEGFNPHFKFSIKRALKLGIESDNEEATVVLTEALKPEAFIERLNSQLPEGVFLRTAFLKTS